MRGEPGRHLGWFAAVVVIAASSAFSQATASEAPITIEALSNRADLVSGGDVLLRVPAGADVTADGRTFANHAGLVRLEGLPLGPTTVTATFLGDRAASLDVTNHPIGGPVIAGPQVQPWTCATPENGLGAPTDEQCNTPAVFGFMYRSAVTQRFAAYDPAAPPPDVATTTTDRGETVPYIVRVERGVIDRGIYAIAVLFDPSKSFEPWATQRGWNGKIVVPFGGGCQPRHSQGPPSDVLDDAALKLGFAVISSGLNILGQNCNDVVSAEAFMMLKEHFIERYGVVRYTIANGFSGGAMQQFSLVANYPGLLDGIQPFAGYPDPWEAIYEAEDCFLLDRYFDANPHLWAVAQQQAFVAGYQAPTTCRSLWDTPGTNGYARTWFDPDNRNGCIGDVAGGITVSLEEADYVYDARTNPKGARCTVQDYSVAQFGRRPDGFANRPYDNIGVQYGLRALEAGRITTEQFVHLNEHVGGIDIDWNPQSARTTGDLAAIETAHRSGRVMSGGSVDVPVIDMPFPPNVEIHTPFHTHVVRERLVRDNGNAANHVIWPVGSDSLRAVDAWLAAVEQDTSDDPLAVKVARNKPADVADACGVYRAQITDPAVCSLAFPHYADPRIAAGGPKTDDVLKCRLHPLDRNSYGVRFTDARWARLKQAFPAGVCDYSKPGVGQRTSVPWLTFADGPGGKALGVPPASRPVAPARGVWGV